jgi:AcrR family transcriptional regulator
MNATGLLQDTNLSAGNEVFSNNSPVLETSSRNPQNKREALVVAATRLFAARGYRATTTRNIAAGAGCAEGLIHRYFHGKLGLLQAVLETHMGHDSADLDAEVPPANNLEDEVRQLLDWLLSRLGRDSDIYRITVGCLMTEDRPKVNNLRILPRGAAAIEGRIRRHNVPESTVHTLTEAVHGLALSFGLLYPIALGYDQHEARQLALSSASMLCRGMAQVDLITSAAGDSQQAFSND